MALPALRPGDGSSPARSRQANESAEFTTPNCPCAPRSPRLAPASPRHHRGVHNPAWVHDPAWVHAGSTTQRARVLHLPATERCKSKWTDFGASLGTVTARTATSCPSYYRGRKLNVPTYLPRMPADKGRAVERAAVLAAIHSDKSGGQIGLRKPWRSETRASGRASNPVLQVCSERTSVA